MKFNTELCGGGRRNWIVALACGAAMVVLVPRSGAHGAQITLGWDAPMYNTDGTVMTNLVGFTVHYGTGSGQYSQRIEVPGATTRATIDNLQPGYRYYIAITARNAENVQGAYSDEFVWDVPSEEGALRIHSILSRGVASEGFAVSWVARRGNTYRVEMSSDLQSWVAAPDGMEASAKHVQTALADESLFYEDPTSDGVRQRFYRVRETSPLPDTVPPTITPPADITLVAGNNDTALIPNLASGAVVADDVSAPPNIVVTQTPASGTAIGLGTTVVLLTARDEAGNTAQAKVAVTVVRANRAPVVNAGADLTIPAKITSALKGSVADDNLPAGSAVTILWTKVSGPGQVTFGDTGAAATTVSMKAKGTYVLRLTASDGALTASDEATVTVQ